MMESNNLETVLQNLLLHTDIPITTCSQLLERILNVDKSGFAIHDHEQRFVYVSENYLKTHNISEPSETFIGMTMTAFLGDYLWNADPKIIESSGLYLIANVKREKRSLSSIVQLPNGCHYIANVVPILDDRNSVRYFFTVTNDLSELSQLYRQSMPFYQHIGAESVINPFAISESRKSRTMKDINERIVDIADTDAAVLLTGESGTGKTVVANYIHSQSSRAKSPMVYVNCSAIPEALMESELFGYQDGSLNGTLKGGKKGLIEAAHGGTLFLDEIGDMPLTSQAKLLVFLQDRYFYKTGSTLRTYVNARVIAATNSDIYQKIERKEFREDLYYRLNVIPLKIPPLRERKQEILELAQAFLTKYNIQYNKNKEFDFSSQYPLLLYQWPGNIRELQYLVERLVITTKEDILTGDIIQNDMNANCTTDQSSSKKSPSTITEAVNMIEYQLLLSSIDQYSSSRQASVALGISHTSVDNKLRQYGIAPEWKNKKSKA